MRQIRRAAFILVALVPLLFASNVNAQSNGLGISPRKDYTIKSGSKVTGTLFLNNLSPKQPLEVKVRVIDFKAANETGTPDLFLAANAPQPTWSLKPFIALPSKVTVPAASSVNIPFTISIPSYQGAGSYYSAVEYTAQNAGNGSAITVAASSATLIFVSVPGVAHESMTLQKFGAYIPNHVTGVGSFRSWFFGSIPQEMAYLIQNNGDVAEDPQGGIQIKNMFGHTATVIQAANPKSSLALIGQTRLFETCIVNAQQSVSTNQGVTSQLVCNSPSFWPGKYTAKLDVLYGISGDQSRQVTASATFWYLPWWFIVTVVVILALIGLAIRLNINAIKGKPKRKNVDNISA